MIKITVKKENSHISEISVVGHAGYAEHGQDIVCAGVSAVLNTVLVGLTEVLKLDISYYATDGDAKIELPSNLTEQQQHDASILTNATLCSFKQIAEEYKQFVKLEVK